METSKQKGFAMIGRAEKYVDCGESKQRWKPVKTSREIEESQIVRSWNVSIREALISETAYKDDILEIYEIHVCKEDTAIYLKSRRVDSSEIFVSRTVFWLLSGLSFLQGPGNMSEAVSEAEKWPADST